MPTERCVSLREFEEHLAKVQVPRRIDEVVVHHTWSPTSADYAGIATVRAVRNYHMQVRGWSDNGYHVMIAPTGEVFLCRPLERSGAHTAGRNAYTIGVCFIANFDSEDPQRYGGMAAGLKVVALLLKRFGLDEADIRFHREFASKTCPGTKMSLSWFRQQVALVAGGGMGSVGLKVVLLPDNEVVECAPAIENGVTRVALRPLVAALGCKVHDHIGDQGKVYVERG